MMQSDKINYSKIKGRTWLIEKTGDKQYGNYTLVEYGTSLSDDKITELVLQKKKLNDKVGYVIRILLLPMKTIRTLRMISHTIKYITKPFHGM